MQRRTEDRSCRTVEGPEPGVRAPRLGPALYIFSPADSPACSWTIHLTTETLLVLTQRGWQLWQGRAPKGNILARDGGWYMKAASNYCGLTHTQKATGCVLSPYCVSSPSLCGGKDFL